MVKVTRARVHLLELLCFRVALNVVVFLMTHNVNLSRDIPIPRQQSPIPLNKGRKGLSRSPEPLVITPFSAHWGEGGREVIWSERLHMGLECEPLQDLKISSS